MHCNVTVKDYIEHGPFRLVRLPGLSVVLQLGGSHLNTCICLVHLFLLCLLTVDVSVS